MTTQNTPFNNRIVREGGSLQATPKTNPQTAKTSATDDMIPCRNTICYFKHHGTMYNYIKNTIVKCIYQKLGDLVQIYVDIYVHIYVLDPWYIHNEITTCKVNLSLFV